jgi:putative nucleotidyltransferase with HDIG domain
MEDFKPLMYLGEHSLLAHCIRLFQANSVDKVVVVTGHRHGELSAEIQRYGATPLHNPEYESGMFSSVVAGLPAMSGLDGFFLLPVDIPLVRPDTVSRLIGAFGGRYTLYPCRRGERGHPPLIPVALIPAVLLHDGSGGMKGVLEQHPGRDVEVWDDGVLMDGDTPDDFQRLSKRFAQMKTGTREEALALARLYMPEKGVAHGLAVAQVADLLAAELQQRGCAIDGDVVHNGALLHDIGKGQPNHEARGAELMMELGLPLLADVVGSHRDVEPVEPEQIGEKELVCLADKLVRGTRRVTVEQRFQEKLELYREDREACLAINSRLQKALALQRAFQTASSRPLEEVVSDLERT